MMKKCIPFVGNPFPFRERFELRREFKRGREYVVLRLTWTVWSLFLILLFFSFQPSVGRPRSFPLSCFIFYVYDGLFSWFWLSIPFPLKSIFLLLSYLSSAISFRVLYVRICISFIFIFLSISLSSETYAFYMIRASYAVLFFSINRGCSVLTTTYLHTIFIYYVHASLCIIFIHTIHNTCVCRSTVRIHSIHIACSGISVTLIVYLPSLSCLLSLFLSCFWCVWVHSWGAIFTRGQSFIITICFWCLQCRCWHGVVGIVTHKAAIGTFGDLRGPSGTFVSRHWNRWVSNAPKS